MSVCPTLNVIIPIENHSGLFDSWSCANSSRVVVDLFSISLHIHLHYIDNITDTL